jgi:putative transposase
MSGYQSLSHSRWDCKYHVVFVPKGQRKNLYGKIREFLKTIYSFYLVTHGIRLRGEIVERRAVFAVAYP